jgi:hypothetical protein
MRALKTAQRDGILERLRHNHKYSVVVSYSEKQKTKATEFAGLLQDAGWTVLGPFVNENICTPGLQIGVPDLHSPCASAHLLVDVLVSVGMDVRLVRAGETLPSTSFGGCYLLFGPSRASRLPGRA